MKKFITVMLAAGMLIVSAWAAPRPETANDDKFRNKGLLVSYEDPVSGRLIILNARGNSSGAFMVESCGNSLVSIAGAVTVVSPTLATEATLALQLVSQQATEGAGNTSAANTGTIAADTTSLDGKLAAVADGAAGGNGVIIAGVSVTGNVDRLETDGGGILALVKQPFSPSDNAPASSIGWLRGTNNSSYILTTSPYMLDGATYDRLRGDSTGGQWVQGAVSDDSAVAGKPVRVGGKDGAGNTQDIATDTDGNLQLADLSANSVGARAAANPNAPDYFFDRYPDVAVAEQLLVAGQATLKPRVLEWEITVVDGDASGTLHFTDTEVTGDSSNVFGQFDSSSQGGAIRPGDDWSPLLWGTANIPIYMNVDARSNTFTTVKARLVTRQE